MLSYIMSLFYSMGVGFFEQNESYIGSFFGGGIPGNGRRCNSDRKNNPNRDAFCYTHPQLAARTLFPLIRELLQRA